MTFLLLTSVLGVCGFVLALYLAIKKKQKTKQLICPLRGNCHDVIYSDYSKFFGVPVEYLGLFYYGVIVVAYGGQQLWQYRTDVLLFSLFLLSTFAALFSLYLTFIQVVTLKKFCTWCLCSALLSLAIFVLTLTMSAQALLPILNTLRPGLIIIHVAAMAIGLGAATLADLFFFQFLRDYRFSTFEVQVLNKFSQVIWFALALIVFTGIALYLPASERLVVADKFWMKQLVVAVIVVNGAFLNLFVAPRFLQIQFGNHEHQPGELVRARRLAFALGPISIISWYSAFLLGALPESPWTFSTMLTIYAVLLCLGVLMGQGTERLLMKKATTT